MSTQEINHVVEELGAAELEALSRLVTERLGRLARAGESRSQPEEIGSIYELVRDLPHPGTGPAIPDLSSNKEHMAGFGKSSLR